MFELLRATIIFGVLSMGMPALLSAQVAASSQVPKAEAGAPTSMPAQNRPITAGGFVKSGPVVFIDDSEKAGLTHWTHKMGTPEKSYIVETKGSGVGLIDYDNDGWLDIFAGGYATGGTEDYGAFEFNKPNHAAVSHLFHNNHDGTFTDAPKALGMDRAITVMAANFGDLDNDGWLDVYLGLGDSFYQSLLPKKMFRNNEGQNFQDVTFIGGFGNLQKGHGISFADIENNGNEDVFEELGGAYPGDRFVPVLYHNPGHGNHWVTLKLEGVKTNRAAFGARIRVTIREKIDGKWAERSIYRAVGSVSSFGGNPMEQHIGMGKASVIKEIEIWWPVSGERQRFRNVAVDRTFHVREGRNVLDRIEVKPFEIGKTMIALPMEEHHQ
jgi:hypothetical protein